jgi:uncharacterized protein YjiS (DUF1127 family)
MWTGFRLWWRQRQLMRQFSALDDRMLRDMGLERDQLETQVRRMLADSADCPQTAGQGHPARPAPGKARRTASPSALAACSRHRQPASPR